MEEVTDVNDVSTEVEIPVEQPTPEESSPEETKVETAEEEATGEDTDAEAESTEDAPEATEEEEAPKPRSAEARKESLNNEIRDLVAKRNVLRDEITTANAAVYQPQTAEELVEQGIDPLEARVQAMEQQQVMADYNAKVTDLNANLSVESLQVLSDFAWANPEAPEYNKALAEKVGATYQRLAGIQTDPQTGLIISANVLPYDIYKSFDEIASMSAQTGQSKGQAAAEKMLASAETTSSAAPKAPAEDPFRKALLGL